MFLNCQNTFSVIYKNLDQIKVPKLTNSFSKILLFSLAFTLFSCAQNKLDPIDQEAGLSVNDFEATGTSTEDTEGFSSMPLEISGMKIAIFIQEDPKEIGKGENGTNLYRISFRSFGAISIRDMAAHFGGGGHKNASGAKTYAKDTQTLINNIKDYVGLEFGL